MSVQDFHDVIANISLQKFHSLSKNGKPTDREWTILSCIVLEKDAHFEVVALGTGSKCIGANKLSKNGDIVNDSHAEIIARRSFVYYLFQQLDLALSNNSPIFNFDKDAKEFKTKENVGFHFFTTHVPCGDAAIFPKQNAEDFGEVLDLKRKREDSDVTVGSSSKKMKVSNDIYRTGAKCFSTDQNQDLKLEGSAYHVLGAVRTKPGRGDPTLSVSCSDKISRWFHLGVQGSLIYFLIKTPIYFKSFTIGGHTPFSKEALERALFHRISEIKLDAPFMVSYPRIGQSKVQFDYNKRESRVACPTSISWFKTNETKFHSEVGINGIKHGVTKKNLKTEAARLRICKLNIFKLFINILFKLEYQVEDCNNFKKLSYNFCKHLSKDYVKAKNDFKIAYKIWSEKPSNLCNFTIE